MPFVDLDLPHKSIRDEEEDIYPHYAMYLIDVYGMLMDELPNHEYGYWDKNSMKECERA